MWQVCTVLVAGVWQVCTVLVAGVWQVCTILVAGLYTVNCTLYSTGLVDTPPALLVGYSLINVRELES